MGYDENTVEELQDILRDRDLPVSGNKSELISRLEDDDANPYEREGEKGEGPQAGAKPDEPTQRIDGPAAGYDNVWGWNTTSPNDPPEKAIVGVTTDQGVVISRGEAAEPPLGVDGENPASVENPNPKAVVGLEPRHNLETGDLATEKAKEERDLAQRAIDASLREAQEDAKARAEAEKKLAK